MSGTKLQIEKGMIVSINTLDVSERVRRGKEWEQRGIEILNSFPQVWGDYKIDHWELSSDHEDRIEKIDAYAQCWPKITDPYSIALPVQIKFRETGTDLGIALYRPWKGFDKFEKDAQDWNNLDRDFVFHPALYVVFSDEFEMITICPGEIVEKICREMLEVMLRDGWDFSRGPFKIEGKRGAEIQLVTDQGTGGKTEGQKKLICYITPALCEKLGGVVYNYAGERI